MVSNSTLRSLAAITDPGLFERLATAVLREADPQYRLLIHTGVNQDGRTVKGPVDAITFVEGAKTPQMITVQHTTCRRDDLKNKWLYDPAASTPRKRGSSRRVPGDVVKTIQLMKVQRRNIPDLRVTLILTTNQEPSEALVHDVYAVGHEAGLEVVIWSGSALAHFLDYDPKGQWVRSQFLGIVQERVSRELLRELSQSSLQVSDLPEDNELWVRRQLDQELENAIGRDVVFVVAESGIGKSVACYKRLTANVERGGFGLVIPHGIIADSMSLDQAIDATLRLLHPSLIQGAGGEARSLASERRPLLMVVEDINRSAHPTSLIERMASWSVKKGKDEPAGNWQLLCPVWPRLLATLGDEARKNISKLVLTASPLTADEGTAAVLRRREHAGAPTTLLEAQAVASALGNDPLLIALQDPSASSSPDHVIQIFVHGSLDRLVESRDEFTAGEYRQSLRCFAVESIIRRCLDPTMTDLATWFRNAPDTFRMLRHIVRSGEAVRVTKTTSAERLAFRHDRVRDWIYADAVADLMRHGNLPQAMLEDPYLAEIIAAAVVQDNIPIAIVEQIGNSSPLTLFCAMRIFGEPQNELQHAILKVAKAWLDQNIAHEPQYRSLRWTVCRVLSESDTSYVNSLIDRFREEQHNWWCLRARFRGGDCVAGVQLCSQYELGTRVVGHTELIDHVYRHRGRILVRALSALLRRAQLTADVRTGALRLAGHLGDTELAGAVKASWSVDADRDERLADYLWASAQCCGGDAEGFLAPVCDAWAALSDEDEEYSGSPRNRLAAHGLRWAFQEKLPEAPLRYFIERAGTSELQWPITFMLHGIDHPDAVDFIARELAATDNQLEGTENSSTFAVITRDHWKRRQEETGLAMSAESRGWLKSLWENKQNEKYLRTRAFQLWYSTTAEGDISTLQAVSADDHLRDAVLFQRLRRRDVTAIPNLVEKLKQDNGGYWWQAGRYIWSDELTESLDSALDRRGIRAERNWNSSAGDAIDWILPERLMELPFHKVEELLLKHWDHLRFSAYYVQAALYTATPRLVDMANQAIANCPNPESMFKHVAFHFGYKNRDRSGITRLTQIEVFLPYLDYLEDYDLWSLWQICNEHGWFEFRRQHLDARINSNNATGYVDDSRALADLDNELHKGETVWAGSWADRFLETGVSVDHMMGVVYTWLKRQTDIKALIIAADIVTHAGSRCHLDILHGHEFEPVDHALSIIANAEFEVKRRSIN